MLLELFFFSGDGTTLAEADKTDKTSTTKTAFAMIMEVNGNNGRSKGQQTSSLSYGYQHMDSQY